jgi:hypothetical protein
MRIFKYKLFDKWAKKHDLTDSQLEQAILEIESGLIDANLGGNVYKKRIGKQGQGKSGAYRTILLMRINETVIFAHGFTKGEKDNISKHDLDGFKIMAGAFLNLTGEQLNALIANQLLIEIEK